MRTQRGPLDDPLMRLLASRLTTLAGQLAPRQPLFRATPYYADRFNPPSLDAKCKAFRPDGMLRQSLRNNPLPFTWVSSRVGGKNHRRVDMSQDRYQNEWVVSKRPLAQRLSAWLLLPAMLMLGLTSTYQLFRCRYDGVARRSCCCPMADAETSPASEAAVSNSGCCDVQVVRAASTAPASAAPQQATEALPLPLAMVQVAAFQIPQLAPSQSWTGEVPRGLGPPLIVLKHSFLI